MNKQSIILIIIIIIVGSAFYLYDLKKENKIQSTYTQNEKIISGEFDKKSFKSDEEWKKIMTPVQYHILREAGTEAPFSGELNKETRSGTYYSHGCDKPLFRSEQKYDSGTGWPSFRAPVNDKALVLRQESPPDDRIEVLDTCGNHLGHVFEDGPAPTGKRYCMNSAALKFIPDSK